MTPDFSGAPCIGRPELFESTHTADHYEAREMCAVCPMIAACDNLRREVQASVPAGYRRYAGPSGTWAGKLVGGKGVAACGTDSGYFRHRRLAETPCDGCRAAHAASDKVRRTRKAS